MIHADKTRKGQEIIHENTSSFRFHILEFQRLRFLNDAAINIVSRLFLSLFADFHPTLKH